ncbi:MAG: hypothetical protein GYA31_02420 [Parcubacteria group bacterium]|nr:hypothetical protein [Parcubacteria group bacterium]
MNKSPTVFLLPVFIIINIFFISGNLLAYAPTTTHANLTDVAVDFYNQNAVVNKLSPEEKSWVIQGSIDEDTLTRCLNHLYDPIFNKTWTFGGIEYLYPALTAKDWAQNPIAQALYDPLYTASLGPISKSPVFSRANFTWQKAIYSYVKGDKKSAYLALGHILHLIEDMTVPAHTREDAHPPIINSDIYEDTPSKFSFSVYQDLLSSLSIQKPLIKSTLNEYFDDTANYSNNYFLSSDTIPPSKYKLPEIDFPDVVEIENGLIKHYLIGHDENNNLFHLALVLPQIQWRLSGPTTYSLDDAKVLNDYWQRLSKKSVINSAGVIKLFFQEVDKAKQNPNFIKNNESNIFLAAVQGINTFINNIFQNQADYITLNTAEVANTTSTINTTTTLTVSSPSTTKASTVTTTTKTTTTTIKVTTTTTVKQTTTTTLKPTTATTKLSFCSFVTNQAPIKNSVIINEVAWMGTTNDSNNEWIELKNISNQPIDLSNWQLLDQGEQIKIVFPVNTTIGANQLLLLERTNDDTVPNIISDIIYVGSLANQNEGLRLFNNACQLEDEVLANSDWPAGDNGTKRTMERKADLTWQTSSVINGTPKQENSDGYIVTSSGGSSSTSNTTTTTAANTTTTTVSTTTTTKPSYPKVLITEIQVSGFNSDQTSNVYNEFIELYNPNDFEVDLTNWYLQKKTSQSEDFSSLVPASLLENRIIAPRDYFLITHASSSYSSITDVLITNYTITDNNTIILKNPNREIVDKIGYGEASDCETNCVAGPLMGQSIQRKYEDNNFLDTDNNFNDFEIQDCPSPKSISSTVYCLIPETTTTTTTKPPITSTPQIPYITEFSWHPFDKDASKIVVDFRASSYPFIPATNYTDNVFTAMAFFLQSDLDDASSTFGIPPDYLGGQDNWTLGSMPSIIVSYPNCQGYTTYNNAIIFTNSDFWCHAPGGARGSSYNWWALPKDNHYVIQITGNTTDQGLHFSPDQYLTIGYYGYDNSLRSYLKLIAYDPTKFYYDSNNYYHEPTNISIFNVSCNDELCNNLTFSWTPSSDEDSKDILTYDIHYVFAEQGDDLNNNNLIRQTWLWSQSQNVLGESIFNNQTNRFELQVATKDLYYINSKRLPGVSLDVFFGIKAVDSEGLQSKVPKIFYLHIPPIIP